MAGHNSFRDSLEEDLSFDSIDLFKLENLILSNHNLAQHSSSSSQPTTSSSTYPQNALITTSPVHQLGLRQNNPQDCSNLVSALVDRATVEISRTIIALNATFSQQLQQASISASNGIKQAQVSATSTISIVVQSASIATSSAFSSVTVANKAVTSANLALTSVQDSITSVNLALSSAQSTITSVNLALTNVSSSSSSDVSRLSSSLSLLQASVVSVQASASAAIAAAQSALASATGSAAAQASSILASAAKNTPAAPFISTAPGSPTSVLLPQPAITSPSRLSLTPGQAAGVVVGVVVFTILLIFAIFFLIRRMKKMNERDSYLDEKDSARSPRRLPSRLSSAFRTGNGIKIKFNPPKSSQPPLSGRSTIRRPEDFPIIASGTNKRDSSINATELGSPLPENPAPPLASPVPFLNSELTKVLGEPTRLASTAWPLQRGLSQISPVYISGLDSPGMKETATAISYSLAPANTQVATNSYPVLIGGLQLPTGKSSAPRKPTFGKAAPKKVAVNVINPFDVQTPTRISEPAILQPVTQQSFSSITEYDEIPRPDDQPEVANLSKTEDITTEDPLENPDEEPENPFQDPVKPPAKPKVRKALAKVSVGKLHKEFNLEELLSPKATRVPAPATLALLREEEEPRNSTVPEIDQLLRMVTKQNENYSDKPLFWSDFRAPDAEVENALSVAFPREFSSTTEEPLDVPDDDGLKERTSPPIPQITPVEVEKVEILSNLPEPPISKAVDTRERAQFPPLQSPPIGGPDVPISLSDPFQDADIPQQELLTPPKPEIIDQKDVSPLRRNPQIRNITSLLAEHKANLVPEMRAEEIEPDVDLHEERGRSMIRTSDLIEARLSWRAQSNREDIAKQEMALTERTVSPLSRNPVDQDAVAADRRARTISSSQLKAINASAGKRRSKNSSPPRHPQLQPIPPMLSKDSISKPVPNIIPSQPIVALIPFSTRSSSTTRPASNAQFSQALSKFQDLASQNPNDISIASNEVTQRAIAGIYIPGSLREQAVRNLSRGQESGMDSRSRSQRR